VYANKTLLRIAAVTLAALVLVFWGQPTGKTILLLAGLLLVALALIEFLSQPPQHHRRRHPNPDLNPAPAPRYPARHVSGVEKTLWVLFLVFLPFLAVFIYLLVRGKRMGERAAAQQQRAQQQFEGYVRDVATTSEATPTEQIARAKELLDAGAINQSEFDRLKAKALA
jgi:ABC-type Fe3+ transport system permease subunit